MPKQSVVDQAIAKIQSEIDDRLRAIAALRAVEFVQDALANQPSTRKRGRPRKKAESTDNGE